MLAKVIDMAKELGIKTLVEGVETPQQYEFLRSLGCGRAQGFLFGRPNALPASIEARANATHPTVEPFSKHDFYEDIGRINLMRPDPHPPVNGQYLPSDVAACIIRCKRGEYEYLNTNDLYMQFLEAARQDFSAECIAAIERCVRSRTWEEYPVTVDGHSYAVRVRIISEDAESQTVAVLAVVDEYFRADAK